MLNFAERTGTEAARHATFSEWYAVSPSKRHAVETGPFSHYASKRPPPSYPTGSPATTDARTPWPKIAALACSPPRASHSEKVKQIFASSAANGQAYRNGSPATSSSASRPQLHIDTNFLSKSNMGSSSSVSTMTSESGLERRLHGVGHLAMTSPHSGSDPMRNLERAALLSSPAVPYPHGVSLTHVTQGQGQVKEASSSDEWTGDDVFMPAHVRRQAREKQFRDKQAEAKQMREQQYLDQRKDLPNMGAGTLPSPEKLRRVAIQASLRSGPLRSPRASRFRNAATHMSLPYPLRELYRKCMTLDAGIFADLMVQLRVYRSRQTSA